jgi:hypothetical protein
MTMVARRGFVLIAALLSAAPAWAQYQAAIGAARGARTDVEQASQGTRPAPAPAPAQPPAAAAPQAPAGAKPSPAPPAAAGQAPAQPAAPPATAG